MGPPGARGGDAGGAEGNHLTLRGWTELLLPTRCLGCGEVAGGRDGVPVCARCRTRLQEPPRPRCPRCHDTVLTGVGPCGTCADWPAVLRRARSVALFRPPVPEVVHGLKYQGWTVAARWMGSRMRTVASADPAPERPGVVVPVPTTPRRFRERGFNPAELLAREVASGLGIPLVKALARPRESPRQVGLPTSRRAANVRDAFVPGSGPARSLPHPHVLLVDDVLTTGATAAEAARVLEGCGARTVSLLTFARAVPADPAAGGRAA